MTISRRDTIIIAVLINVGLLAILFITAIHEEGYEEVAAIEATLPQRVAPVTSQPEVITLNEPIIPVDEVDHAINAYAGTPTTIQEPVGEPIALPRAEPVATAPAETEKEAVEITVKSGDSLDKIAKANKTSIDEIRKINNLTSDKLKIGQLLKVPVSKAVKKPVAVATVKKEPQPTDAVYYTLKSGDSPWKVAKQFKVDYEEVLKLNGLSEDKARNLKIGDQIRIK